MKTFLYRLPWLAELARFCSAGLANTAFTIALYQVLLRPCGAVLSYSIAWMVGLLLVGIFYPRAVYRVKAGLASRVRLVTIYATTFLVGLALTALFEELHIPSRVIIFIVVIVTAGANYLAGRLSLRGTSAGETAAAHE